MKSKLVGFLGQLGVSLDEAEVYLYLVQAGEQSVLAISRGLDTGRTKLYPLLDNLADKQLIHVNERHYGSSYSAQPLETLEFLVAEKQRQSNAVASALPAAKSLLAQLATPEVGGTKFIQYRGLDGLKQVSWNITKAKGEYFCFELANLDKHQGIPKAFAEKVRSIEVERGIVGHDLTNNPNWKVESSVPGYTSLGKARYVDPKIFTIEFESIVYDDTYTLVKYEPNDIVCIEIKNPSLAHQQKQLFNLVWSLAVPVIS